MTFMQLKSDDIEKELTRKSIFIIGRVLSVEGRIVKIRVNKNKNSSHIIYKGAAVKNVSVGSYIKIVKGFIEIIGKVEGEFVSEEKYFNKQYKKEETKISRTLYVSLFGHFDGEYFRQGIKEMPLIDNECYLLDRQEFDRLHHFYERDQRTITVGNLTEEPSQKIKLDMNKLFASHIGIFGNTGSGKSNTLARIYTELFKENATFLNFKKKSKFVILDFNGEYAEPKVISEGKDIYSLSTGNRPSTKKYKISKENIRRLEILSVLLEATEKTQMPFLGRAISNNYVDNKQNFNAAIVSKIEDTLRTLIKRADKTFGVNVFLELFKDLSNLVTYASGQPDPIEAIWQDVETNLGCHSTSGDYYWGTPAVYESQTPIYDNHLKANIDALVFKNDEFTKLKLAIILTYFFEISRGFSNPEHIRPIIGRMFKKFAMLDKVIEIEAEAMATQTEGEALDASNLHIISLKNVNIEMKKVIPLMICKQLYDEKKEDEARDKSLHIIIDEAHNILSTMSQRESETWKDYRLETFEEIIKEGRKFGTFLTIASQRPYDISPTIISQLHNYFIHRLINNNDIDAIERTVAYLDKLSFQSIPILSVGSCFVAGLASDIPVKVDIDFLPKEYRPRSETVNLEESWKNDVIENAEV